MRTRSCFMQHSIMLAVSVLSVLSILISSHVEAARAGQGRSVGVSRSNRNAYTRQQPTPSRNDRPAGGAYNNYSAPRQAEEARFRSPSPTPPASQPPVAAPSPTRSWVAPLAGVAAGLGLGYLLGHSSPSVAGGATAAASGGGIPWFWLLLCAAGAWWWFRRRNASLAAAGSTAGKGSAAMKESLSNAWGAVPHAVEPVSQQVKHKVSIHKELDPTGEVKEAHHSGSILPDQPAFLKAARQYFVSLQAAFDKGDLEAFREWMVPELLHDLMGQIQERGTTPNQTDVVTLNAMIIDERVENGTNWVSVRFSGTIREQEGASPQAFNEVWHFTQSCFTSNDPWKLAGIEPVQ